MITSGTSRTFATEQVLQYLGRGSVAPATPAACRKVVAYFAGRLAFDAGTSFGECPCQTLDERHSWERGWLSVTRPHRSVLPISGRLVA